MNKRAGHALLLAAVAFAGAQGARVALGDERAATASLVEELDHDAAHKAATGDLVKRARAAMERATRFRATGDEAHATLADGLARQEAEAARDLVRAIDAERAATDARLAATDAGVVGERERALLEEGIARNGRLRAEIEEAARARAPGGQKSPATARVDGGAP